MSDPPPIKLKLVEIYDDNWDEDNVIKPVTITTEAFESGFTTPAISIPTATETSVGESGYKYMSNTGPVQQKIGEAQVNIWVTVPAIQDIDETINAEDWLDRARQEVGRITINHVVGLSGYDYIAWDSGQDRHELKKDPVVYRRMSFVKYAYKKRQVE